MCGNGTSVGAGNGLSQGLICFASAGILYGKTEERKKNMTDFPFDEHTPLIQIWEAYPWLSEVLPKMDKRFAVMNTAMGKILMKKNSVTDLSKVAGFSPEKLLNRLKREVEQHEAQNN